MSRSQRWAVLLEVTRLDTKRRGPNDHRGNGGEAEMKHRKGAHLLGPTALSLLQECFDALVSRYGLARSGADADVVATALIEAYQNGATDKFELMRVVDLQAALRHTQ